MGEADHSHALRQLIRMAAPQGCFELKPYALALFRIRNLKRLLELPPPIQERYRLAISFPSPPS